MNKTVLLLIAIQVILEIRGNQKFVVIAEYSKYFSFLKHSYQLYYGKTSDKINTLPVEFDFYYDKTIFTNASIDERGIICGRQIDCGCEQKESYITDSTHKNLLETHRCHLGVYLSPKDAPVYEDFDKKTEFYLKSDLKYYRFKNLIGLSKDSDFLNYLQRYLDQRYIKFSFETNFVHKNAFAVLNNYSAIKTKMTINEQKVYRYFYQSRNDFIGFTKVDLKFSSLNFNIEKLIFDYNLAFMMKVPVSFYEKFVAQMKTIICIVPETCEKEKDLILNYDRSQVLSLYFPEVDSNPDYNIFIKISELFFVDSDGFIQYNLVPANKLDDEVILGLLLLKKLEISFIFDTYRKTYTNFLVFKDNEIKNEFYIALVSFSFLLTLMIFFLLLRICKPLKRLPSKSKFGSQMLM